MVSGMNTKLIAFSGSDQVSQTTTFSLAVLTGLLEQVLITSHRPYRNGSSIVFDTVIPCKMIRAPCVGHVLLSKYFVTAIDTGRELTMNVRASMELRKMVFTDLLIALGTSAFI